MARRTNILSTILGGFGGGAEGGLAQRERSLAEQERRRVAQAAQRAEARQGQSDIAGLVDRGYVTPAQQTASMRKAAPGLQEALGVASGMLGQGPPRAFSGAGVKALESAAGQYGAPVADVTVGGQRMIKMETPMQEALREAEATSARAARDFEAQERTKAQFKATEARESAQAAAAARTARISALQETGMPRADAVKAVELEAKYPDVVATPGVLATRRGQDIGAETTRRGQALQETLALQRASESERDYQLRQRAQESQERDAVSRMNRLPVSVQTKIAAFNSGVEMARSTREAVRANADAVGLKNVLPGIVTNRTNPEGVETRAMIEALTGEIRNQRFGGQLTKQEAKLAEKFLPDAKDTPQAVLGKLTQLEAYLESKRKGLFDVYKVEYAPLFPSERASRPDSAPSAAQRNPYR